MPRPTSRSRSASSTAPSTARTAPFFRFPFLRHSPETLKYLADRNVAVFSTDIDSFDFKGGKPDALVKRIMANLEKRGKGIILMHDIQPHTAAGHAGAAEAA